MNEYQEGRTGLLGLLWVLGRVRGLELGLEQVSSCLEVLAATGEASCRSRRVLQLDVRMSSLAVTLGGCGSTAFVVKARNTSATP